MLPLTAVSCNQGVQMSCFEVRNPRDAKTDSIPQTKHEDGRATLRLHPDKNPPEAQFLPWTSKLGITKIFLQILDLRKFGDMSNHFQTNLK